MSQPATPLPLPHARRAASARALLAAIWSRPPLRVLTAAAVPAVVAAALAWLVLPRGPVTSGQALVALGVALAAGFGSGLLLRSRWALLLAPAAFALVFELRWLSVDGPTVDAPRLDEAYGILALLLGRGFFGLVALLPMLLGAALGAAAARRLAGVEPVRTGRRRATLYVRRSFALLATLAVAAVAALCARPGTTAPILGPDGEPLAGSIATLEQVRLGGAQQWISLRGESVDKPVLLYLHGGPGQAGMPFTRVLLGGLERDFVVVDWDQRGTGKSHAALEPRAAYTLDRIVGDTLELARYLRKRFDEERIYVAGTSWGSLLGVLAVQREPELFHAFVGGGQMVSTTETDRRIYRDLLAHATRTGDDALAAKLRGFDPPPYDDVYANAYVMEQYERIAPDYELLPAVERLAEEHARDLAAWGVLAREYDLVERVNVLRGLMEMFSVVYPQLADVDFRRDVPRLEVPVYVVRGAGELAARDDLAVEWLRRLEAPRKRSYLLEHGGHAVLTERPDALRRILVDTVLPETYPGCARVVACPVG